MFECRIIYLNNEYGDFLIHLRYLDRRGGVGAHDVLNFIQLGEFKSYAGNEAVEVLVESTKLSSIGEGLGNFDENLLKLIQEGGERRGVCRHF